ncbi:SH3 domain-binding glutamic acid-rich -like protein [Sarcoptes scabiei]|uniref:SH3 domain-binding glutamic acid-rich -like protein n=1 Tax=Sarcoptes scabiei TaxID=52283 RepID=A0A132AMH5_SARSC|nr:SH3 domain-binding glutamic acid-rich -like protein [Sarcoptes scabiei]KPM11855.1 SH3 domain-binding glutamic acid-rich protein-like protein [Sarcoptes scabiei]
MVIKVFISGISASKEVKKHQLRAQFLLDSYKIKYELVDISDPTLETARETMMAAAKRRNESQPPQPPQFFNEEEYCGDYEDLENANDNDELFEFLKLEEDITIENGNGDDENDLFIPPDSHKNDNKKESDSRKGSKADKNNDENADEEVEDEELDTEIREQITINGVVYDIPKSRKITVGGRTINVDELLATEGEEVDLDSVDEKLKEGL